jgi:hypothetical protein
LRGWFYAPYCCPKYVILKAFIRSFCRGLQHLLRLLHSILSCIHTYMETGLARTLFKGSRRVYISRIHRIAELCKPSSRNDIGYSRRLGSEFLLRPVLLTDLKRPDSVCKYTPRHGFKVLGTFQSNSRVASTVVMQLMPGP